MRRFPSSWDRTLVALGFRRRVKRIKRDQHRRKNSRIETLERREMLAGDTPTPIRPEYFLVGEPSDGNPVAPPFVVSTEYAADDTPTAIVEFSGTTPDYGLHELSLELRLGSTVLETQEVAVNLTKEAFSSEFYRDRLRVVSDQLKAGTVEEIEAWRDELGPDGVFTSLGVSTVAGVSDDPLLASVERFSTMISLHRTLGNLLTSETDRENLYAGLARVAGAVEQLTPSERTEAIRTELGRSALLVGELLAEDLANNSVNAPAARDAMLAVVSPYYTVLGTYGVNIDLSRTPDGALVESALSVVEEGVFSLGESLRIEMGEHTAFVGATIVPQGQSSSSSSLTAETYDAGIDAAWNPSTGSVVDGGNSIGLATDSNGEVTSAGRFQFNLSGSQGKVPTEATLTLQEVSAGTSSELRLKAGWDAWDLALGNSVTDAERFGADHDYSTAPIAPTSSASGVYTFDVTEAVQRSLLLGDANADGTVDHDYQGTLQRRGLLGDVNAAYLAIRDWDQYRTEYGGLELVPGDLLYRVDANWDGVASAADGQLILNRLGVAGGDFNLDGEVDVSDLARYQANYGQVVQQFGDGDADFNGIVNASDEAIWSTWNTSDFSELSFREAKPFFEVFLPDEGSLDLVAEEADLDQPTLEIDYQSDLIITDLHARDILPGQSGQTKYVSGRVVIEFATPHEPLVDVQMPSQPADDVTAQLMRVPEGGGAWEPIGTGDALSATELSQGFKTFDLSDIDGLQAGDGLAVEIASTSHGFTHRRMINVGIATDSNGNVHAFGTEGVDRVDVQDDEIRLLPDDHVSSNHTDKEVLKLRPADIAGVTEFNQASLHLDGSDDGIHLSSSFTGTATIDGGTGSDWIRSVVPFDAASPHSVHLDIRDTKGVNSFETVLDGFTGDYWQHENDPYYFVMPYFSGQPLDPGVREAQTVSFDYEDFLAGDPPQNAAQYHFTLADEHSLTFVDAPDSYGGSTIPVDRQTLIPNTLVVDTLIDAVDENYGYGELSLREALHLSDILPGEQTIEFDPSLFGVAQETIRLTSGSAGENDYVPRGHWGYDTEADRPVPFMIRSGVQINGPGADLLALDAWGQSRVFVIDTQDDVAIRDLTVKDGFVEGVSEGGALYAYGKGDLLIERTVWAGNQAIGHTDYQGGRGGAIFARGTNVHLVDSTFDNNDGRSGGAIYFRPDNGELLTIERSTFSENIAAVRSGQGGRGSALVVYAPSTITGGTRIENSTFSGNWARYAATIYVAGHASNSQLDVQIVGSTIASNEAHNRNSGGAGLMDATSGVVRLDNTILADNLQWTSSSTPERYDLYHYNHANSNLTGVNNLIGVTRYTTDTKTQHLLETAGNLYLGSSQSAGLLPLGDYGGLTQTHALTPDSPAVDQGNDAIAAGLATDQRGEGYGYLRGVATDIGSYEADVVQAFGVLTVHGTAGDDDIIVAPGVVYIGGLSGEAVPFDQTGYTALHVHGGDGDDRITLLPGVVGVTLFGDAGNDTLFGSNESETLDGGAGSDQLFGRGGNDILIGGVDNDTLYGGDGNDTLRADAGDDTLYGGAGQDTLLGGDGDDRLDGGRGSDKLFGGPGNDRLDGGIDKAPQNDELYGDHDSAGDTPTIGGEDVYILHTAADLESGDTAGSVLISAAIGADTLDLSDFTKQAVVDLTKTGANESVYSDPNATIELSGPAIARVIGTDFDDTLIGTPHVERLEGGGGNDIVIGGGGDDHLLGGGGDDHLLGFDGTEVILDGGYGDDTYWVDHRITSDTTLKIRDADGDDDAIKAGQWDDTAFVVTAIDLYIDPANPDPQVVQQNDSFDLTIDLPAGGVIEKPTEATSNPAGDFNVQLTQATATSWTITAPAGTTITLDAVDVGSAGGVLQASDFSSPAAGNQITVDYSGSATANGLYPIRFEVSDAESNTAYAMATLLRGDGNASPTITPLTNPADPMPEEGTLYAYEFDVVDIDPGPDGLRIDLVGEVPVGLLKAHLAYPDIDDPNGVIAGPATTGIANRYRLAWTPGEEDDGEHNFSIRVTDSALTPKQHTIPVSFTVAEVNTPPAVLRTGVGATDPFDIRFQFDAMTPGDVGRIDPTLLLRVANDGDFDDVRIAVDWDYTEPQAGGPDTFVADQYISGLGQRLGTEVWDAVIRPDSHRYFTDLIEENAAEVALAASENRTPVLRDTKVAIRVEEYVASGSGSASDNFISLVGAYDVPITYTTDSSGNALDYRPIQNATPALSFGQWGLVGGESYDDTPGGQGFASTDVTIRGRLDNVNGAVADLEVYFYASATPNGFAPDDIPIGIATTDSDGFFEFPARKAFDPTDFTQDQTVQIRAEVQDPSPTVERSKGLKKETLVTTAGLDPSLSGGETFTLTLPTVPQFDGGLTYSNAPALVGYGIVRQPVVKGSLVGNQEGVEIFFDDPNADDGAVSIAITDENGDFEFLVSDFDTTATIEARVSPWDEFRQTAIRVFDGVSTVDPPVLTVEADKPDNLDPVLPSVTGFAAVGPAHNPTFAGSVPGYEGVVVQVALSELLDGQTVYTILGEALTDETGGFELLPSSRLTAGTASLHARLLAWDAEPATGSPQAVEGAWSAPLTVQISATAPTPTIAQFDLFHDTGTLGNDGVTFDPRIEGTVGYTGDMRDIEVSIDLDGDEIADAIVLPDEEGRFYYTPTGLEYGQPVPIKAWATAPSFADEAPAIDPALRAQSEQVEIADADSARAWLEELFHDDGTLGGDWYNADFAPDLVSGKRSAVAELSIELQDPISATYTIVDLDRLDTETPPASYGSDPTFNGRLASEGATAGVVIEFYTDRGAQYADPTERWELDGKATTRDDGTFSYTPRDLPSSGVALRAVVQVPDYTADGVPTTQTLTINPYLADPLQVDPVLNQVVVTLAKDLDTPDLPTFNGRIVGPDGFNVSGQMVQLQYSSADTAADGIPDGVAIAGPSGDYDFEFESWPFDAGELVTITARVAIESQSESTQAIYVAAGDWATTGALAWQTPEASMPTITRFELANDTGVEQTAGANPGDPDVYHYDRRTLDRTTTDPTVVGRVDGVPVGSRIEFSHRGDGTVDGYAVIDEFGRFEYLPEGLGLGYWDLRARVTEDHALEQGSSDWQELTSTGDPSSFDAGYGLTLIVPTPATIANWVMVGNAQIQVTFEDEDSIDNVFIDFYENLGTDQDPEEVLLGSSQPDANGIALFTLGRAVSNTPKIIARPREISHVDGEAIEGNSLHIDLTSNDITDPFGNFFLTAPSNLHEDYNNLTVIDPTVHATVSIPGNGSLGVSTTQAAPSEVIVEVIYSDGNSQIEKLYDTATIHSRIVGETISYEYTFTPDLSIWTDGIPSNGEVAVRARAVGALDGEVRLGDWSSSSLALQGSQLSASAKPEMVLSLAYPETTVEAGPLNDDPATSGYRVDLPILQVDQNVTVASLAESWTPSGSSAGTIDVEVIERYLEIKDANNKPHRVEIDLFDQADLSDLELGYGVLSFQVRIVEEAIVKREWTQQSYQHRNDFVSETPTRIAGEWRTIAFTLPDPAPTIDADKIETDQLTGIASVIAGEAGAVTSQVRDADAFGGITVEFDHDNDGSVDGSAITYADGSFEYTPTGLRVGQTVLRMRAVDPYQSAGADEDAWVSVTVDLQQAVTPQFAANTAVELENVPTLAGGASAETTLASESTLTTPETLIPLSHEPVLTGKIDLSTGSQGLADLRVEIDYDGDGQADAYETPDLDGRFTHEVADTAYGERAVRVRTVARAGLERVTGVWSDPIEFFYASDQAPVITASLVDQATGEFAGRTTIAGFGAASLIEVVSMFDKTADDGNGNQVTTLEEHRSYVRAGAGGGFATTPPRLVNGAGGTHTVRFRGLATIGGDTHVGEWTVVSLTSTPLSLASMQTVSFAEYGLAYDTETQLDNTNTYGDVTVSGRLADDYSRALVEFDHDGDGTYEGRVTPEADGTFEYTPADLEVGGTYALKARIYRWNPDTGMHESIGLRPLLNGSTPFSVVYDPTVSAAPAILVDTDDPDTFRVAAVDTAGDAVTLLGKVVGPGKIKGLVVYFDHNDDGVPDGQTITDSEGEFLYQARGLEAAGTTPTIQAWVESPVGVAPAAAESLEVTLNAAPPIADLTYRLDPTARVTGQVGWNGNEATSVEYRFEEGTPIDTLPAASGIESATVPVSETGRFFFAAPEGATAVYVRALAGEVAGRWKRLVLGSRSSGVEATTIGGVELAFPDSEPVGAPPVTLEPVFRGKVGGTGQGAYATVEAWHDPGTGYERAGRVIADASGRFTYELPADTATGTQSIKFRAIAWDAASRSEVAGTDSEELVFELVSATPTLNNFRWETAPDGLGNLDNPTVLGTVNGVGRKAGLLIEFDHNGDDTVDGFAYTDANGDFRYTPRGLSGPTTIVAQVVTWDAVNKEYDRAAFDTSKPTADSVTATLSAPTTAISPIDATDLSYEAIAMVGLEDAIFSTLADLGLAGGADGTIHVGTSSSYHGEAALLHGGGGEEADEFEAAPVFAAKTGYSMPGSISNSSYEIETAAGGALSGTVDVEVLLDEITFTLVINSYAVNTSPKEDDAVATRLDLSGTYSFTFTTVNEVVDGGGLSELDHLIEESLVYDYTITERASLDTTDGLREAVAIASLREGSSESLVQIGTTGDAAKYRRDTGYTAPLAQTETSRVESRGVAGGPVAADSDGEGSGGVTVDRTYVETVTKDGDFTDADRVDGSIEVSILERVVTTEDTTNRVATDDQRSTESIESSEVVTSQYDGLVDYVTGQSRSGNASLTETTTYTSRVDGSGIATDGDDAETWNYVVTAGGSSTLIAGGSFYESLDEANPSERSNVSGTLTGTSSSTATGDGTTSGTTYAQDGSLAGETRVAGSSTSTVGGSVDHVFTITSNNGSETSSGTIETTGTSGTTESAEGTLYSKEPAGSEREETVEFLTNSRGGATSEVLTNYRTTNDRVNGRVATESVTYDVTAFGTSSTGSYAFGSELVETDDGPPALFRFVNRLATTADLNVELSGTGKDREGSIEDDPFEPSRSGRNLLKTKTTSKSQTSLRSSDLAFEAFDSFERSVEDLGVFVGDEVSGTFKHQTTGSAIELEAYSEFGLSEEDQPGALPEVPEGETWEGAVFAGITGSHTDRASEGVYSDGPNGRTETGTFEFTDGGGVIRASKTGLGDPGNRSYSSNAQSETIGDGSYSTGGEDESTEVNATTKSRSGLKTAYVDLVDEPAERSQWRGGSRSGQSSIASTDGSGETIGSGSSENRGFTKTFTPLSGGGHSEYSIGGSNSDWSEWESSTDPTPIDSDDPTTGTSYQLAGATSDFIVISTDIGPGRFSWNRSDDFQTGESTQNVTVTPEGTTVGFTNDSAATTTNRWRATSNEGNGAFSSSQGFSFSDTTSFSGGTVSDDTSTLTVRNFSTGNAWANSKQRSAGSIDGGQGSTVTTTHDSRGTQRSGATVNNGRVSSSYSDDNSRSDDNTTWEGHQQAPGGSNGERGDGTTVIWRDGQITVITKSPWKIKPFTIDLDSSDYDFGTETREGEGTTETTTKSGGGKKESAKVETKAETKTVRQFAGIDGNVKNTKTTILTNESESLYQSGHKPGEHGAQNGRFKSTRSSTSSTEDVSTSSWDHTNSHPYNYSYYDYDNNEPQSGTVVFTMDTSGETVTTITNTSESSARETGGVYSDKPSGQRKQSANFIFKNKTSSVTKTENKDVDDKASDDWRHGEYGNQFIDPYAGSRDGQAEYRGHKTRTEVDSYESTTKGSYDNKGEKSKTTSNYTDDDTTTGNEETTSWIDESKNNKDLGAQDRTVTENGAVTERVFSEFPDDPAAIDESGPAGPPIKVRIDYPQADDESSAEDNPPQGNKDSGQQAGNALAGVLRQVLARHVPGGHIAVNLITSTTTAAVLNSLVSEIEGGLITGKARQSRNSAWSMLQEARRNGEIGDPSAERRDQLAAPIRSAAADGLEAGLLSLPGGTVFELGQLANGQDARGNSATGWTFVGVLAAAFGGKWLFGGAGDEVVEGVDDAAKQAAKASLAEPVLVKQLGATLDPKNAKALSKYFRKVLGATKSDGKFAHHILPLEAARKLPNLFQRAARGGFDINGAGNGRLLSGADHVGGHPEYNRQVIGALTEFEKLARQRNFSDSQIAAGLQGIAEKIGGAIDGGWVPRE